MTDTKPVCQPRRRVQWQHNRHTSQGDTGTYWKTSLYQGWRWLEERQVSLYM